MIEQKTVGRRGSDSGEVRDRSPCLQGRGMRSLSG